MAQAGTLETSNKLRRISTLIILLLGATFTFQDYWTYSSIFHAHPESVESLAAGTGNAPQQYRVGVIFLAKYLGNAAHHHLGYRHFFAFFDLLAVLAACWCVRETLFRTRAFAEAGMESQWFRTFTALGLFLLYMQWSYWYQRPETWVSTLFVAASMYILSAIRSGGVAATALVLLACVQALVRSDVAILFDFALLVYGAIRGRGMLPAPRAALLAAGLAGTGIATAVLWLLMHVIFPHATYGDTKVVQLLNNLHPSEFVPFLLFMVPSLYTAWRGRRAEPAQKVLLLASLLYLLSWVVLGRAEEVRIFIPFAFALVPLTVNAIAADAA